ncbi:patatin-like phospholipase family protein [Shinella zoogloeoides]|uniref:patatin-like phospholipase family protein n=1 Tax=Shinella zoogloeoides TaxID=352475 RepID=UPI000E64A920|nr:patatin-like phospholipase family protein [Shinella zoogloeoides]
MTAFRFRHVSWVASFLTTYRPRPRLPYSAMHAARPSILDLSGLRYFADDPGDSFRKFQPPVAVNGEIAYLALSGGGADGAFGAGALAGLSDAGSRPTFSVISGVSTGALIAPFAFLGSRYDPTLAELYTSGIAASLVDGAAPLSILATSGPLANNRLRALIDRYVDEALLSAIAAESAGGRILLVITTNLDTQRASVWNLGKIAEIGTPEALALFRQVLTASASVPIIYPPVLIEAEADGHRFEEMHVDGSVTFPIHTLPETFLFRGRNLPGPKLNLYVLINNKLRHDFRIVPVEARKIAARSASTLVKMQTRAMIFETYNFTRRNGSGFNLAYMDDDISTEGADDFDTDYMRSLFDHGYARSGSGDLWNTELPPEAAF